MANKTVKAACTWGDGLDVAVQNDDLSVCFDPESGSIVRLKETLPEVSDV